MLATGMMILDSTICSGDSEMKMGLTLVKQVQPVLRAFDPKPVIISCISIELPGIHGLSSK